MHFININMAQVSLTHIIYIRINKERVKTERLVMASIWK